RHAARRRRCRPVPGDDRRQGRQAAGRRPAAAAGGHRGPPARRQPRGAAARRYRRGPRDFRGRRRPRAVRRPDPPEDRQGRAAGHDRLRHAPSRLFRSRPGNRATPLPGPHYRALPARMARAAAAERVIAAADLAAGIDHWQRWLTHERRASAHTLAAYRRDLAGFLSFLAGHLGQPACLADLAALTRADFRAWLAARSAAELQATSTARALSVVRNFFRFLAKHEQVGNAILGTIRTPRLPRAVPKALTAGEAEAALDTIDVKSW